MFHRNHPTYHTGKTAKDYKVDKTFKSKTSDDGDVSGFYEYDGDEYYRYDEEAWTRDQIIKIYRDQASDKKEKDGAHTTFAVYDNGCVFGTISRGCHAMLSEVASNCRFYNVKLKELWVSLWAPETHDVKQAKLYWDFMFNKDISPWRGALKDHEIIYDKDKPIAFVLKDFDCPWQLSASLAICSRMPYAQGGFLDAFLSFRNHGFSDIDAAFLCASVYRLNGSQGFKFPYYGDFGYCTDHYAAMDYTRWRDAKYYIPEVANVHKGDHYNPTNTIFGSYKVDATKLTDPKRWLDYTENVYNWGIADPYKRTTQVAKRQAPNDIQWLCSFKEKSKTRFNSLGITEQWSPLSVEEAIANLKKNEHMWKAGHDVEAGK